MPAKKTKAKPEEETLAKRLLLAGSRRQAYIDTTIMFGLMEAALVSRESGNDRDKFLTICGLAYDRAAELHDNTTARYFEKASGKKDA